MCPECPRKDCCCKSCRIHPKESGPEPEVVQVAGKGATFPTLLSLAVLRNQHNYLRLLKTVQGVSIPSTDAVPAARPENKPDVKMNEKENNCNTWAITLQIKLGLRLKQSTSLD